MSKKQTAVDWLIKELRKPQSDKYIVEITKQAIQMEREQIEGAVIYGQNNHSVSLSSDLEKSKNYYTQTYGECTHKS